VFLCLLFQEMGKLRSELRHLGSNHHLTVGLLRIVREIIPVIVLRGVEISHGADLRHDRAFPQLGRLIPHPFRSLLLFGAVIEDHRSVLSADIIPLAVQGGGIVDAEEYLH